MDPYYGSRCLRAPKALLVFDQAAALAKSERELLARKAAMRERANAGAV